MAETTTALLRAEIARLGSPLAEDRLTAMAQYLDMLARWGRTVNLTGADSPAALVSRHVADGIVLARELPVALRCLDVGSGAGLPGLLVAIVRPDLELTLVEPRQRRCAFLRTVVHALGLRVHIESCRVEERRLPPHDVAWSRATWSPAHWLQHAGDLVRPGGQVVAFLGREPAPEPPAGYTAPRQVAYALADDTPRVLAFYASTGCFT